MVYSSVKTHRRANATSFGEIEVKAAVVAMEATITRTMKVIVVEVVAILEGGFRLIQSEEYLEQNDTRQRVGASWAFFHEGKKSADSARRRLTTTCETQYIRTYCTYERRKFISVLILSTQLRL